MTVRRPDKPSQLPPALLVAASLVAVEGLLFLGYAVLEFASVSAERVALGVTTAIFFTVYGALLLGAGWAITRGHSWARSPMVLAQLIQLGVAWNLRGGETTWVAVVLAAVALVVLVGLLSPASIEALAQSEERRAEERRVEERGADDRPTEGREGG